MNMERNTPGKKYKRVKRSIKCPNPLFEKWLTEWRDEAKAKKWKSQYQYQKALSSMKKYPVPLQSGKEAKMLEFIGDKLSKMLDDKLKEHYSQNPSSQPSDSTSCSKANGTSSPMKIKGLHDLSDDSNGDTGSQTSPTKQIKRKQKTREYIPVNRSGAYALLITLYENELNNGPRAFMKKMELMDTAEPYSDKSFKIPEPGKYYTAWSSMATIIQKELVTKEGCPAKYFLTDKGLELAKKLADNRDKATNQGFKRLNSNSDNRSNVASSQFVVDLDENSNSQSSVRNYNAASTSKTIFEYCYVTETGQEVHEKSKALVSLDDGMISFLVKCKKQELFSSGKFFKLDVTRPESGEYVYAYLHNSHAEETSPINECSSQAFTALSGIPSNYIGSQETTNSSFTLHPGSFDIVLCVDVCETVSGAVNSRKLAVQQDLRKNGVDFDVRKLNVGDFIWVAREKVSVIPGQLRLPNAKELVLDFIIERKRLDDLASSIKDGRFHEQKYRLKHCGLHRPIYLVEEMGSGYHFSMPESALNQAVANTQVIDNFTVQRTANQAGTIRYLTIMTRYLQSLYSRKTLHACSYDNLPNVMDTGDDCRLMAFAEFNSFSVKNKEVTVGDMLIKQLIQIGGLSIDKAVAITERHSTPSSLMRAYEHCFTEKDKESLLADVKFGMSQRKVGPKLSKTVSWLYCNKVLR